MSNQIATTNSFASSTAMPSIPVERNRAFAVVTAITNVAPAAKAFTAAVTDICTAAGHGYLTGLKVQLTTTVTLPAGLSLATDYWVIKLSDNTFSLGATLVDALAGTAVDITGTGTGVHTITATAIGGASVKLQGSMDNVTFVDLPIKASGDVTKSASITATANVLLVETDTCVNYVRTYYTMTAGQLSVSELYAVRS
jgi:hypothetical protein